MSPLSFDTLRSANLLRMEREEAAGRAYVKCKDWIPAQWLQALVGEVGELANIMKKIDRGDFDMSDEGVRDNVAKELADIQTYLDIYAAKLNIDLGDATVAKFNEVSVRVGSDVFIFNNDAELGVRIL